MKLKSVATVLILIIIAASGWKWKADRALAEENALKVKAAADMAAYVATQVTLLADEARNLQRTPDQGNLTSDNLPPLPWKKVDSNIDKAQQISLSKKAKTLVLEVLKDPLSASFKESKILTVLDSRGHRMFICGLVNAKNSFGGYTGFKAYIFETNAKGTDPLKGGVGDEGSIASVRFDDRWWRYDADDLCLKEGVQVE